LIFIKQNFKKLIKQKNY